MLRMGKFWLAVALFVGMAMSPRIVRAQDTGRDASFEAAATVGPERIAVTVTGLSCPFCAYGLEKRLRKLEGLDRLSIEFETGQIILIVRDGSKASDERIRQLVKDSGFEATKIERSALPSAS